MPIRSKAQWGYLWLKDPEIAHLWAHLASQKPFSKLPQKVKVKKELVGKLVEALENSRSNPWMEGYGTMPDTTPPRLVGNGDIQAAYHDPDERLKKIKKILKSRAAVPMSMPYVYTQQSSPPFPAGSSVVYGGPKRKRPSRLQVLM